MRNGGLEGGADSGLTLAQRSRTAEERQVAIAASVMACIFPVTKAAIVSYATTHRACWCQGRRRPLVRTPGFDGPITAIERASRVMRCPAVRRRQAARARLEVGGTRKAGGQRLEFEGPSWTATSGHFTAASGLCDDT